MSKAILDYEFLARRRVECGLARRTLAGRIGVSATTVLNMERDAWHGHLSLGLVERVATALSVEPHRLLMRAGSAPEPPADDDVQLEAVLVAAGKPLHRDDIARGLGWTVNRVTDARAALERRLANTGSRVVDAAWGYFGLRAATEVVSEEQWAAVTRAQLADHSMLRTAARWLRQVVEAPVTAKAIRPGSSGGRRGGYQAAIDQARALAAGHVRLEQGVVHPSDDLLFSLGLTDKRGDRVIAPPPPPRRSRRATRD